VGSVDPMLITIAVVVVMLVVLIGGMGAWLAMCLKTAAPEEALVVTMPRGRKVSFTTIVVMPVVHTLDRVSLREHAIPIERRGDTALRTGDDQAVELVATFRVRVNRTTEDVLRALGTMGPRTGDLDALRERFTPTFTHALEAVGRELDARAIDRDREAFRHRVLEVVGSDLDGFVLADLAVTGVRVVPGSPSRG